MDFLQRFDESLYQMYLDIQDEMSANPQYAVSKAQLFVQKLYGKLPEGDERFLEQFSEELAWLIGLSGAMTMDDALTAHEMLYRMASWVVLNFETSQTKIPAYNPPVGLGIRGVTESEVISMIEQKVLPTLCGIIKEMDTMMSVLDDVEKRLNDYAELDKRLAYLEGEIDQLKILAPSNWNLKARPRTLNK